MPEESSIAKTAYEQLHKHRRILVNTAKRFRRLRNWRRRGRAITPFSPLSTDIASCLRFPPRLREPPSLRFTRRTCETLFFQSSKIQDSDCPLSRLTLQSSKYICVQLILGDKINAHTVLCWKTRLMACKRKRERRWIPWMRWVLGFGSTRQCMSSICNEC